MKNVQDVPDVFLYNLRVSSHSICYKCPLVERNTLTLKNIYTRHILQFYTNIFLTILQFLVGVVVWLYNFQL